MKSTAKVLFGLSLLSIVTEAQDYVIDEECEDSNGNEGLNLLREATIEGVTVGVG